MDSKRIEMTTRRGKLDANPFLLVKKQKQEKYAKFNYNFVVDCNAALILRLVATRSPDLHQSKEHGFLLSKHGLQFILMVGNTQHTHTTVTVSFICQSKNFIW